jgi:hypothetical protein
MERTPSGLRVAASRQEALRLGLTRYRGQPCPHGHDGLRRITRNGKGSVCDGCARARSARRSARRPETC